MEAYTWLLYFRYEVYGFALVFVYDFGVDLGCAYVCVAGLVGQKVVYKIAVCHNLSVFPIERLQRYGKNRKSLKNPSF